MIFRDWLIEVDEHIGARVGVSIYDLPDRLYRDAYEDGIDPEKYAEDILVEVMEEGYV